MKTSRSVAALAAVILLGVSSCKEKKSDEQLIRESIDRVQAGVEQKRPADVKAELDASYRDSVGNRREQIPGFLLVWLRRYVTVGSFIKIDNLTVTGDTAEVQLTAWAWAGERGSIVPDNADRYDFKLRYLKADDAWKIARADFKAPNVMP